jgi:hypothetical protein
MPAEAPAEPAVVAAPEPLPSATVDAVAITPAAVPPRPAEDTRSRTSGLSAAEAVVASDADRMSGSRGVTRPSGLFTPPAPAPSQSASPKRPSPFDEIGFLRTVVGRVTPFPEVEVSQAPSRPVEQVPSTPTPPAPEPPPSRAAARPTIERASERAGLPAFEAPPIPDAPATTPARASAPVSPAFADDPPQRTSGSAGEARPVGEVDDAARSLKCQECGCMNYPTEWYCEKCGGELAAF